MCTGFSSREGFVRLVMTRDDYDCLVGMMAGGIVKVGEAGGIRATLRVLEATARILEGDPETEKMFPDLDKAIEETRIRVGMLGIVEEMLEKEFPEEPEPAAAKPN